MPFASNVPLPNTIRVIRRNRQLDHGVEEWIDSGDDTVSIGRPRETVVSETRRDDLTSGCDVI
jgi:hypothetical protein